MMKNRKSGVFYNKEDDTDVITLRGAIMFENKQWLNEMEYDRKRFNHDFNFYSYSCSIW